MFFSIAEWFSDVAHDILDTYARDSRFGRAGLVLFLGLGVLAGGLSLVFFPEPIIRSFRLSAVLGLVAALVAAMVVAGFGGVKLLDWQFKFNLERFGATFCVALGLGAVRFLWFLVRLAG